MFGSTTDKIEMNSDAVTKEYVDSNANEWETGKVDVLGAISHMIDTNKKN